MILFFFFISIVVGQCIVPDKCVEESSLEYNNQCCVEYFKHNYFQDASKNVGDYNQLKESHGEVLHKQYDLLEIVNIKKQQVVKVVPPLSWYQTLRTVEMEIKFAYRHDVAGCASTFNETIKITNKTFNVQAYCNETQDYKLLYSLQFPFWASVDSKSLKIERIPVGKIHFSVEKATKPARWRTLYKEGTQRPKSLRLDVDKHLLNHYYLYQHEEDEIEDFEGHDMIDSANQDPDDVSWLFPAKGPGEFKKLKKRKKTKK